VTRRAEHLFRWMIGDMDPTHRWKEIRTRFDEILALDPGARSRALAELRSTDPAVAEEVATLLRHAEKADSQFEGKLLSVASGALRELGEDDTVESLPDGGRVGSYQVTERIGRGGAGTVYRAVRTDGSYERVVAVKVLRRGLDTSDLLARFQAERQILASLSHSGIAALLDGGSLRDGRPFLVMEFVEGEPLDAYCDGRDLPVPARLRLFLQVCDAVGHAHRNLVLHRDLKPSNILVEASGKVRLLDFGIAKILDPERLPGQGARTRSGLRLFTPEYAAPEQVQGTASSVATDVYQLGHLLFRLLAGRSPYHLGKEASVAQLQRAIVRQRPLRMSGAARTKGDAWCRRLRGDLDAIVGQALRKDPDRRYPTVQALSDDIRRHMEGRPVRARPDSTVYRARKFVGRNPWPTSLAALLAVGLAAYVGTVWQYTDRLAQERDLAQAQEERAVLEAARAAEVRDFVLGLFEAADPVARPEELTLPELVDRAAERAEDELEGQPEVQASVLQSIGTAYRRLGRFDDAENLLSRSLTLRKGAFGEDHPETAAGMVALGALMGERGRVDSARVLQSRALGIYRSGAGADGEDAVISAASALALTLMRKGRMSEAVPLHQEALDRSVKRYGEDDLRTAIHLHNRASVAQETDDLELAESLFLRALEIRRQHLGEHARTAVTLNNLGLVRDAQGRHAEAEPLFREAMDIRRRTLGEDHPEYAVSLNNVGLNLMRQDRYHDALEYLQGSLDLRVAAHGEEHPSVGVAAHNLADAIWRSAEADTARAEALFRRAHAIWKETLGSDHFTTAHAQYSLARLLRARGRVEEAEGLLERVVEVRSRERGEDHSSVGSALYQLARVQRDRGRPEGALATAREAVPILESTLGPDHERSRDARRLLSDLEGAAEENGR
jgi:eukaryotic-like serine/threonine-protein kinase